MVHFVDGSVTRVSPLDVAPLRPSASFHAESGVRALRRLASPRFTGRIGAMNGRTSRVLFAGDAEGLKKGLFIMMNLRVGCLSVIGRGRSAFSSRVMWVGLATLLAFSACPCRADTPTNVTRVEEDWELVIGEPNVDDTSPQIITLISPINRIDAECAVLELNHSTQPDYLDGGVQFQRWFGDFERIWRAPYTQNRLAIPGEKINYTMTMKIESGLLQFGVRNGTSQTWGAFGGESEQWNSSVVSQYANLDGYSSAISTKYSRIGYAANRVQKFSLKEVRYYQIDVLILKDTSEKIVYQTPVIP